jgi:uncharacterized protein (TIGR03382 family)
VRTALATLLALAPGAASAYSLKSGFTESCHEKISVGAYLEVVPRLDPEGVPIPDSEEWDKLSTGLIESLDLEARYPEIVEPEKRLILISLLIGVRAPDTEGHSVSNLRGLRRLHADPSPEGQYAHALRGPGDDGPEGDAAAVAGTREIIVGLFRDAYASTRRAPEDQIVTAHTYLDFYGRVPVEVWEPAYLLGRAVHAVQDSFAHTIRSDDLTRVIHVMNYVDAIAGDLDEPVDGLAHSETMDACEGDNEPVVAAALRASAETIAGGALAVRTGDAEIVSAVLDRWLVHQPGCTAANDYCGSKWAAYARREQTGPYLEEIVGCATTGGRAALPWLALLGVAWLLRRRRRALPVLLLAAVPEARAAPFVQVEGHASVLSDTPDRSLLASTFGAGLRGGWRFGAWGVFGHVERNWWLSNELDLEVVPGALNLGVGGEYRFLEGFARTSVAVGPSILWYDTALDEKGEVGLFVDVRPLGLRWPLYEGLALAFEPLSFAFVAPVLGDVPIRLQTYRTLLAAEYGF